MLIPPKIYKCVSLQKDIFGFYHIALMGHWKWVVVSQVDRIIKSGLYGITKNIFVSIFGDPNAQKEAESLLPSKFKVIRKSTNIREFEFPALIYMYDHCRNIECNTWYIHTKGVSYSNKKKKWYAMQAWRLDMENFVIDKHTVCNMLLNDYDACGIRWTNYLIGNHFSGNFWWSKSSYIKTLPDLRNADRGNRYECESWIGKSNGKMYDGNNYVPAPEIKLEHTVPAPEIKLEHTVPALIKTEAKELSTNKKIIKPNDGNNSISGKFNSFEQRYTSNVHNLKPKKTSN